MQKIPLIKKEDGFIQLIVLVVIALLLMKYYGVTITESIEWFKNYFSSVLR